PFPLAGLGVLAFASRRLLRASDAAEARRERLRVALAVFAQALLPKMLLACLVVQYGFVLAMPVTLLAADSAVSLVPSLIAARGGAPGVFRAVVLAAFGGAAWAVLTLSSIRLAAKTVRVGSGRDAFLADGRGLFVDAA